MPKWSHCTAAASGLPGCLRSTGSIQNLRLSVHERDVATAQTLADTAPSAPLISAVDICWGAAQQRGGEYSLSRYRSAMLMNSGRLRAQRREEEHSPSKSKSMSMSSELFLIAQRREGEYSPSKSPDRGVWSQGQFVAQKRHVTRERSFTGFAQAFSFQRAPWVRTESQDPRITCLVVEFNPESCLCIVDRASKSVQGDRVPVPVDCVFKINAKPG